MRQGREQELRPGREQELRQSKEQGCKVHSEPLNGRMLEQKLCREKEHSLEIQSHDLLKSQSLDLLDIRHPEPGAC